MITTRPQAPQAGSTSNSLPSAYGIGDEVVFVPASQIPHVILSQGVTCKIVGVTFELSKVLYELALPLGVFNYYEDYPLLRVDSIFVFNKVNP